MHRNVNICVAELSFFATRPVSSFHNCHGTSAQRSCGTRLHLFSEPHIPNHPDSSSYRMPPPGFAPVVVRHLSCTELQLGPGSFLIFPSIILHKNMHLIWRQKKKKKLTGTRLQTTANHLISSRCSRINSRPHCLPWAERILPPLG